MSFYTLVSYKPRVVKNEKYYHTQPTDQYEVDIIKHNLDFTYKKHACVGYYRTPDDCFRTACLHAGLVYILSGNDIYYVHVPDGWRQFDFPIDRYLDEESAKSLQDRLPERLKN